MSGPSVKVPVDWLDSDEAEALGADAVLLMITALGYSARQVSDGVVPRRILRKLWPVEDLERCIQGLVDAGEVEVHGDDLLIVRWAEFILARSEVEHIRAGNAQRQERFRRHQRGDHSMCDRCSALRNAVSNAVTNTISNGDPTRSAPTRSDLKGGEGEGGRPDAKPADAGPPPSLMGQVYVHYGQRPDDVLAVFPNGAVEDVLVYINNYNDPRHVEVCAEALLYPTDAHVPTDTERISNAYLSTNRALAWAASQFAAAAAVGPSDLTDFESLLSITVPEPVAEAWVDRVASALNACQPEELNHAAS